MPIDLSGAEPFEQQAREAEQRAVGMGAQAYKLPDMLRQAVTERFQGSPLYGQREAAAENVMTSGTRGREQLAGLAQSGQAITSPTQQQAILGAQRAADVVPLMSLNDLLRIQTGGIEGLVGSGTNAFNAMVAQAQGQAGLARQAATSQYDQLFQQAQTQFQQQQFEEQQRQFNEQLALSQQKATQTGAADAKSPFDLYLESLFMDQQVQDSAMPTEEKPTGTPSARLMGRVTGEIRSPLGQWIFIDGEWLPIVD